MIKSRQLACLVFSFVVVIALYGTTHAALLAEIGINVEPAFDGSPPPTESILYRFGALSLSPTLAGGQWERQVISTDVG